MYAVCMYTYTVILLYIRKNGTGKYTSKIDQLLMTKKSTRIDKIKTEQLLTYQSVDKINTKRRRFARRF
ncbi:hypothetical protein Hanom_Chr09g00766651 [Helianthus anomalus]